MRPDTIITSILDRYENNQPVTPEEKAVLHKWLIKSLQARNLAAPRANINPMKMKTIRKKIRLWRYVFIILMLIAIAFTLYLFAVRTGNSSNKRPDGNIHSYYQEVRTAGGENGVEFS